MIEEYQYNNLLGETEFRLLELHPDYEALSYEWGKGKKDKFITCAGAKIAITSRLAEILRQLRHEKASRMLWIDAICINQDSIAEKNHQVRLMRDIFAGARTVLVWLGSSKARTCDAFQMLNTLAKLWIKREVERVRAGEIRPLPWVYSSPEEEICLRREDKALWDAVYELFERQYFSRTWIVQEIAVATKPTVFCGSYSISWPCFSWAAAYVGRSQYHLHESPSDKGVARINMIDTLRQCYQAGEQIPIYSACTFSQGLEATNPSDKVYGLLGLIHGRSGPLYSNELLKIDYSLPIYSVYLCAAQESILQDGDLRICHCQTFNRDQIKSLPSWAPDWSTFPDGSPTVVLRSHNRVFGSTGGKPSFHSNAMHVDGYLVDSISCVTHKLSSEDPLPDIQRIMVYLALCDTAEKMPEDGSTTLSSSELELIIETLHTKSYHRQESIYEALWRTLIANTADFTTVQPSFQRHFDAVADSVRLRARGVFWELNRVCDEISMDLKSRGRLMIDLEAKCLYLRILEQDSSPYFRELVNTIAGRVFFTTTNGYFGIGSPGAKRGDRIAILNGGWAPFILQQQEGFFRIRGDAYVHRIQDVIPCLDSKKPIRPMVIY